MDETLYTETLWEEWSAKECENYTLVKDQKTGKFRRKYLKKGYLHFDSRFWFPENKGEIKKIVSKPSIVAKKAFHPFVKITLKTPRYKFDKNIGKRKISFKPRPICFASHIDSLIFGFYSHCLTKIYEEFVLANGISDCVLAYRTDLNACNIDFSRDVFEYIKKTGPCTAIALDIKGFFDHINHKKLKENWLKLIKYKSPNIKGLPADQYHLYRSLTKFSYVNKNTFLKYAGTKLYALEKQPNTLLELLSGEKQYEKFNQLREFNIINTNSHEYGIPQGSSISALLSNIYMIDFDMKMMDLAKEKGFLYRRYCDDILFVCDTILASEIKQVAYAAIEECLLEVQTSKEEEIEFRINSKGILRGFNAEKLREISAPITTDTELKLYKYLQYLGFEFNGQNVGVRSSSLSRYNRKMKARVTKTVKMAYSPFSKGKRILKKKLLHRYSHLGKRNFITYALNAASQSYKETKLGINSPAIRRQVSGHYKNLINDLVRKNQQRIEYKRLSRKLRQAKS